MKKILLISSLVIASASVFAQSTTPRFGITKNRDNTFAPMTFGYQVVSDTAGSTCDTIKVTPNSFDNNYIVNLTDSAAFCIRSLSGCKRGDRMTVTIINASGASHCVYFIGAASVMSGTSGWAMSSTGTKISPASSKKAILKFYFDGALWSEESRSIQ